MQNVLITSYTSSSTLSMEITKSAWMLEEGAFKMSS